MTLFTETVGGAKIFVVKSNYLELVAQGKTPEEALDAFDKVVYTSILLARRHGLDSVLNLKDAQ